MEGSLSSSFGVVLLWREKRNKEVSDGGETYIKPSRHVQLLSCCLPSQNSTYVTGFLLSTPIRAFKSSISQWPTVSMRTITTYPKPTPKGLPLPTFPSSNPTNTTQPTATPTPISPPGSSPNGPSKPTTPSQAPNKSPQQSSPLQVQERQSSTAPQATHSLAK